MLSQIMTIRLSISNHALMAHAYLVRYPTHNATRREDELRQQHLNSDSNNQTVYSANSMNYAALYKNKLFVAAIWKKFDLNQN